MTTCMPLSFPLSFSSLSCSLTHACHTYTRTPLYTGLPTASPFKATRGSCAVSPPSHSGNGAAKISGTPSGTTIAPPSLASGTPFKPASSSAAASGLRVTRSDYVLHPPLETLQKMAKAELADLSGFEVSVPGKVAIRYVCVGWGRKRFEREGRRGGGRLSVSARVSK